MLSGPYTCECSRYCKIRRGADPRSPGDPVGVWYVPSLGANTIQKHSCILPQNAPRKAGCPGLGVQVPACSRAQRTEIQIPSKSKATNLLCPLPWGTAMIFYDINQYFDSERNQIVESLTDECCDGLSNTEVICETGRYVLTSIGR